MAISQNGWQVIPDYGNAALLKNPVVPGTSVQLLGGILRGDVATVLLWVAQRFHESVEPLRAGQCWGFEPRPIRGSSQWSNHASGTAIDLNSVSHGLGASGTFTAVQVQAIRALLAACGGVVRWGGDYSGRKDEMHFEVSGSAIAVASLAARLSRDPGKPAPQPSPGKPGNPIEGDDMPYSAQEIKELVHGGVKWALEDIQGIDPLIIKAAVGAGVDAAVSRIGEIVRAEVAKALPRGVQADADQFQAAKEIIHDGAKWALEDPGVDVSRFPKA